eukprot:gene13270-15679_t
MDSTAQRSTEDAAAHELKQGLEAWDAATTRQPDEEQMKTVYSDDTYQQAPDEHELCYNAPYINDHDDQVAAKEQVAGPGSRSSAAASSKDGYFMRCGGEHILIGARHGAEMGTLAVAAAGLRAEVLKVTAGKGEARLHNGAYWYHVPGGSVGFAESEVVQEVNIILSEHCSPNKRSDCGSNSDPNKCEPNVKPECEPHDGSAECGPDHATHNETPDAYAGTTDANGNVYLTGMFWSRATFGTGYTATVLSSSGNEDIYVAKLSSMGTILWAIKAGGASTDIGYGIATSAGTSDVFVAGWFQSTMATFGSTVLTGGASGDWDAFLMKVSNLGTISWVLRSVGPGNEEVISVEADPSGSGGAIMTGDFSGTMTFGSGYSAHVLVSKGYEDMFTLKVSATGTVVWAMQGGGSSGDDIGSGVAIETSTGNVFVTGWMESSVSTFGATAIANRGSSGSSDVFVLKASSQGTVLWVQTFGGTANDFGRRIQADAYGDVVLGGCFHSTYATFGGESITAHTGAGGDVFVAKVSGSGTVGWTAHAGGSSDECAYGIVMNATTRDVYVTGFTQSSRATFGDKVLTPYGYQDVFVLKLSVMGTTMWAMRAGGSRTSQSNHDQGRDVALDSDGNVYVMGFTAPPAQFGSVSVAGNTINFYAF